MNGLQTEFIDSCARELGSKRLRIQLPWDQTRFENLIERRQQPVIRGPDWVDFPLQLFSHAEAVAKPAKLDRFNTKFHLSEVSWVASENKKLNLALQCWKVIVLDSTQHTDLGRLLMQCIEHGRSEDYIWQVVSDTFCKKQLLHCVQGLHRCWLLVGGRRLQLGWTIKEFFPSQRSWPMTISAISGG
jgi:hypothetical protein